MPTVSTHVLDGAAGGGLAGIAVELRDAAGAVVASEVTGPDGRVARLASGLPTGTYTVTWQLDEGFVAAVAVAVRLAEDRHYHVPLLASGSSATAYLGV